VSVVVDTSVWIAFFRGKTQIAFEEALKDGQIVVPPIVAAELLSSAHSKRQVKQLEHLFASLGILQTTDAHWMSVGSLRRSLSIRGMHLSIPDVHIAMCAIERGGSLMSHDAIFEKISAKSSGLTPLDWVAA
jgi:predicted nucleic acid-binding protein